MILDGLLAFSNISAGGGGPGDSPTLVGNTASTNSLDLHMLGIPTLANLEGARDLGIGDDPALKILCQVSTAFASGGAATLQINLQGAPDNGSGAAGAFSTWWSSPSYTIAQLVAGARLFDMDLPRPPQGVARPRFLQLQYVVGVAAMTAGVLKAFVVLDRHDQPYSGTSNAVLGGYRAGITVAN